MKGGIYRRTEYYVYCDDPHGTCPLDGMQGTIDSWDVQQQGPKADFMKHLRAHGWVIGKQYLCPECAASPTASSGVHPNE